MQQRPFLAGGQIPWWQKGLALLCLVATIALAAVIGVIILYALLVILVVGAIAGALLYIKFKFFPPKGMRTKSKRGPDNITITETPDGVVIDMPQDAANTPRERRK